ncbi:MAG: cytochrome c oxidase subunit II, partial [Planctomycetia bacterium]
MSKWSFFFLMIPVIGVAVFAVAPLVGWSLPENVSTLGREIDELYSIVLVLTGVVFVGTQIALWYVLFRFARRDDGRKAVYTHGNRFLEVTWTLIPAGILLWLAMIQFGTYVKLRFPQSRPAEPAVARVVARQFEWRIVYPGPDGKMDTVDDLHVPNELHIVKGRTQWIDLRSMDVIHSFFLPHLRIKQDAVPGMSIPVWFDAQKSTRDFQSEGAAFTAEDLVDPTALAKALTVR